MSNALMSFERGRPCSHLRGQPLSTNGYGIQVVRQPVQKHVGHQLAAEEGCRKHDHPWNPQCSPDADSTRLQAISLSHISQVMTTPGVAAYPMLVHHPLVTPRCLALQYNDDKAFWAHGTGLSEAFTRSALSASWILGTSTIHMVEDTPTSCLFRRERLCPGALQLQAHLCRGCTSPAPPACSIISFAYPGICKRLD